MNLANEIYTETVAFLTRLSARYARLLAEPVAPGRGDHRPDGKGEQHFSKGRAEPGPAEKAPAGGPAALMALDVRLGHCYTILAMNPQGCFTKTDGRSIPAAEATKKLDDMAQNLGEKIDRENELIKAVLESDRKGNRSFLGVFLKMCRVAGRRTFDGGQCVVPFRQCDEHEQFLPCQHQRQPNNNNANNSWAVAPGFQESEG